MIETKIFLQTPVNPVLDRWVNIFFSLSIIVVFTVYSGAITHQQILIGLLLAFLLTFTAFLINWLTIDGAVSATIFGMIAYGLGGTLGAGLVLAFFISGSILSKDQVSEEGFLEKKFRRDGKQVWANGFWFCLGILIWFFTKQSEFLVAASASLAATTSDTCGLQRSVTGGLNHKPGLLQAGKKLNLEPMAVLAFMVPLVEYWGLPS